MPLPAPPLPSSPHHHRLPSLPRLLSPWRPTASTSPLPGSPPPPPPFPSTLPSMAHMGRVRHPTPPWHIRGGARGRPSPPGQIRRPPPTRRHLPSPQRLLSPAPHHRYLPFLHHPLYGASGEGAASFSSMARPGRSTGRPSPFGRIPLPSPLWWACCDRIWPACLPGGRCLVVADSLLPRRRWRPSWQLRGGGSRRGGIAVVVASSMAAAYGVGNMVVACGCDGDGRSAWSDRPGPFSARFGLVFDLAPLRSS